MSERRFRVFFVIGYLATLFMAAFAGLLFGALIWGPL